MSPIDACKDRDEILAQVDPLSWFGGLKNHRQENGHVWPARQSPCAAQQVAFGRAVITMATAVVTTRGDDQALHALEVVSGDRHRDDLMAGVVMLTATELDTLRGMVERLGDGSISRALTVLAHPP